MADSPLAPSKALVMDLENAKRTNIDRRTCHRTVPFEIIGPGMSRTGTSSLRQALLDLGYNDCYHMASVFNENPRDAEMWAEAMDAKYYGKGRPYTKEDWDQLLGHCMAAVDSPAALFYKELLQAYPNAKVILTVRDSGEQWFKSQMSTIIQCFIPIFRPVEGFWAETGRRIIRFFTTKDALDRVIVHYLYSCYYQHIQTRGAAVYEEHIAEVMRIVPREQLLVFNVKEGWKPLCEFLGKDVPDHPFPRLNDTKTFLKNQEQIQTVMQRAVFANMAKTLGLVLVAGLAGWILITRKAPFLSMMRSLVIFAQ